MLAQKIGRADHSGRREIHRAGADPPDTPSKIGVRPQIGMRVKLAATARRPLAGVGRLPLEVRADGHRDPPRAGRAQGRAAWQDCFKLLHFHLGSQITNIRHIKQALNEAARDLRRPVTAAGPGWSISTSAAAWASITTARRPISSRASTTRCRNTPTTSSIHIQSVCDDAGVPHPTIVSESGRAIVAYHSAAGVQRAGRVRPGRKRRSRRSCPTTPSSRCVDLMDAYQQPHRPQRAGSLPRRPAGPRHGHEPVRRRLFAAGAAQPGREPVLGHLPQDPAADAADGLRARGAATGSMRCSARRTSAISRSSSRCPTVGPSSSCSPSCRSTG